MGIIERLPEPVRSSLRSGTVLFDVTRVVEELVYNSLDAGASKISILIGIGTSYVKVVDDGSGITRDGLVLLGERYVTSKCCDLVDMDAKGRTFGFRGEALASISDVSLLEIKTKACGKANGYHKVMKGCKCLYFGIDDDREDVGTTVVVRDLFYNQPVRRKHMQSSPKKVLHAVRKCVLRIALLHSKVSFNIVDSESESSLLCTYACSSPLSLLRCCFGSEVYKSLQELEIGDGNLKLSGYICSPFDSFPMKAVQYVYINKRFICKSQIHKLLNQLASRFLCLGLQTGQGFESRKRSRSLANPAYILNLDCPGPLYDLTFESSKTVAQFKDWNPILTFIGKSIQQFWEVEYNRGEPLVHKTPIAKGDQLWKDEDDMLSKQLDNGQSMKKSRMQSQQASHTDLFSPLDTLTKDGDLLPNMSHDNETCEKAYRTSIELNDKQLEMEFSHEVEHFLKPWNTSLAKWEPDNYFGSEGSFFDSRLTVADRCDENAEDGIISLAWKGQSPELCTNMINGSAGNTSSDFSEFGFGNNLRTKPFLMGCSSGRSFPLGRTSFPNGELNIQNDITVGTHIQGITHDDLDVLEHDSKIQASYICAETLWQDEESCSHTLHRAKTSSIFQDIDSLSKDFVRPLTYSEDLLAGGNTSSSDSKNRVENFFSGYPSRSSPCLSETTNSVSATDWEVGCFIGKDAFERSWRSGDGSHFRDLIYSKDRDCEFNHDINLEKSNGENCISSCINSSFIIDDIFNAGNDLDALLQKPNHNRHFSLDNFDKHTCQNDFIDWRLPRKNYKKPYESSQQCRRSRRGHSAPPFCKRKISVFSLGCKTTDRLHSQPRLELNQLWHPKRLSGSSDLFVKPCPLDDLLIKTRTVKEKMPGIIESKKDKHVGETFKQYQSSDVKVTAPASFAQRKLRTTQILGLNGKIAVLIDDEPYAIDDQISILDISSGFLSLAGNSLVPESINNNFLEDAKVLLQLDKKFIPVVSGGTLAVIDQHAADERIRLEDLRQKVLSGEGKSISYLDVECELMLPEMGYQLLQNYADQIKEWGWICNIHAQDSKSFQMNMNILHTRGTLVTLMAVPCILGVNLSDIDLLEFLHQLADTDGSSTMPPSVLRVLNSKACRGAIMFGDSLLHSECSLIVEELKQTSLCFQCAHGRPTTVPLVNLEALHKQIKKLVLVDDNGSCGKWHGLQQYELSVERSLQRLGSATG